MRNAADIALHVNDSPRQVILVADMWFLQKYLSYIKVFNRTTQLFGEQSCLPGFPQNYIYVYRKPQSASLPRPVVDILAWQRAREMVYTNQIFLTAVTFVISFFAWYCIAAQMFWFQILFFSPRFGNLYCSFSWFSKAVRNLQFSHPPNVNWLN